LQIVLYNNPTDPDASSDSSICLPDIHAITEEDLVYIMFTPQPQATEQSPATLLLLLLCYFYSFCRLSFTTTPQIQKLPLTAPSACLTSTPSLRRIWPE
jgi:hypothetical protein